MWFLVCWSLCSWWSSWPFLRVFEGSWIDFTYCWLWELMAPMSANHSNKNLLKSFKKEVPHTFWVLVNALFTKQTMLFLEGIKYLKDNVKVDQLPLFTNAFHSRHQKSKILKKRRVLILSGFLLPVFFLYLM